MVTPNARRNRGQVILIGAITLAFILLGIVVVFNGVLYTETISESSTSQSTADAEMIERDLERSLVEIARQGNENGNWSKTNFNDTITNPGEFADQYQNVTANSRSAFVDVSNVTAKEGYIETGHPSGKINISDNEIQHLVLNLDATSGGTLTIDANSTNVTINSSSDDFEVGSCDINSSNVRFDLVNGTTNNSTVVDCDSDDLQNDLSIINSGEKYEKVEFDRDGDDDLGTYEVVASNKSGDKPDGYYGVWKIEADVTYQSNQLSYKRSISTIVIDGDNE